MPSPVCLLVHAAEPTWHGYESALGLSVHAVNAGSFSGSYDGRTGIAGRWRTPDEVLAKWAPQADRASPIVLVAFSAGCWAVREWLRSSVWRERCLAVVLVDGYHAKGTDQQADVSSDSHAGVLAYAREAVAARRCLVVTHSQIHPCKTTDGREYASTRATATALLDTLDLHRDSAYQSKHQSGLHVVAGTGNSKTAHSIQLRVHGPAACREYVAPILATGPTDPAPPPLLRGCDISKWQDEDLIDWERLSELCEFVVCRATYGAATDSRVVEHVKRARRKAMSVGLYHFFRPHQDARAQFEMFCRVDESCGYDSGDIVPALDIEDDPYAPAELRHVSPAYSGLAERLCNMLVERYGDCLVYITQRDWHRLGKPEWVLRRPLWVAHWNVSEPTTPNDAEWVMWQRKVAPLVGAYARDIDQNVAKRLVLVPHEGVLGLTRGEVNRLMGQVALALNDTFRNLP